MIKVFVFLKDLCYILIEPYARDLKIFGNRHNDVC
jgi:hypothetical protein